MRVVAGSQLTLSLEPGLLQRYRTLRECLHHSVMNDPRGMKAVAADVDLSVSELSRRLTPTKEGDPRSCDIDLLVDILDSTNDYTPLRWLIARFMPDDTHRHAVAVQKLERMLPEIAAVLREVKSAADEAIPDKRGPRK